ncbi:MAG TPA: hypothetical protein VGQ86_09740, partial [Candidatus Limnocylindria bacterium]|nr:hypothetical protein [Candidatus Limnocylindria bacterium]
MTRERFIVAAGVAGLIVLTIALLIGSLATVHTAPLDSYQRTSDPRKLVVNFGIDFGDEIAERTVREDARSVTVSVRIKPGGFSEPPLGPVIVVPVVVSLKDPLGDRVVLDQDGRAVREIGGV